MRINYKGFFRFVFLFLINILLWIFFRGYINLLIGIIMVLAAILSVFITVPLAKKTDCQFRFPAGLVAPDCKFDIQIVFHNPVRFWIFFAELRYRIYNKFTGDVGIHSNYKIQDVLMQGKCLKTVLFPGRNTIEKLQASSELCGAIFAEVKSLYIDDLLHLVRVKVNVKPIGHAMVYPMLSFTEETAVTDIVAGFSKESELSRKGADYNPEYEIREYVPGDDLKTIHWKLSAKQDTLMVRERLASGHEIINVVFEMEEDTSNNQQRIGALQDVCYGFLRESYPVELFWWSSAQNQVRNQLLVEDGELEKIICEILSMSQEVSQGKVEEFFHATRSGAGFVRITTGQWKGEYVQKTS